MLSNDVIKFAEGNTTFYEGCAEFYGKKNRSMEDEKAINEAFLAELESKSGFARTSNGFSANPVVQWAFRSITDAVLTTITPAYITPALTTMIEMNEVAPGEGFEYKIEPNSLYTVSNSARGERTTYRVRDFSTEVVLHAYAHQITIYENYYSIIAGKVSYAKMIVKAADSIKTAMYKDALAALDAGLSKIKKSPYDYEGAFDPTTLMEMCENVSVFNGNRRTIIAGTRIALMNILPAPNLGYRINVDGNGGSVQILSNFNGYDIIPLDQAAAGKDKLLLSDKKLYVISPDADKLVKGVVGTEMSNSNEPFDNADLTKNFTITRDWNFQYLSSAKAAVYTIKTT